MVWDGPWVRNKLERYLNLMVRDCESVNTCLVRIPRGVVDIVDLDMTKTCQFLSCTLDLFRVD